LVQAFLKKWWVELVAKPPKKSIWKSLIMKAVERYWAKKIREIATWYRIVNQLLLSVVLMLS
jgi:hypothetical protein